LLDLIKHELYKLDEGLYNYLKHPVKQIIANTGYNGQRKAGSFEGRSYSRQYFGPSKGGIRYAPIRY
jgi:hypothetical protein